VILDQPVHDKRAKICLEGEQCHANRVAMLVFKFLESEKHEKRAKNAKNEVFEFKMSSICVKSGYCGDTTFLNIPILF
jgi:hypothetical protein